MIYWYEFKICFILYIYMLCAQQKHWTMRAMRLNANIRSFFFILNTCWWALLTFKNIILNVHCILIQFMSPLNDIKNIILNLFNEPRRLLETFFHKEVELCLNSLTFAMSHGTNLILVLWSYYILMNRMEK